MKITKPKVLRFAAFVPSRQHMFRAIELAREAREAGDYAIGAVVTLHGEIVGESGNRVKLDSDPTLHAEMGAIRAACRYMGARHLDGAVLYTTAETCPMCASAAVWARMAGIVSGSTIGDMALFRSKFGSSDWSWRTIDITTRTVLEAVEPQLFHVSLFMRDECLELFHRE